MAVKLDTETIRNIAAFEKITKVHARDCLVMEDCVYFLVEPDKMGVAIGKNGSVIKEVRKAFGKPVKLFGYRDKPEEFLRGVIPNISSMDMNGDSITITVPNDDRVAVIGKNGRNIKAIKEIMRRHFDIKNLKLR